MKRLFLALAFLSLAGPADAGRRFNRTLWQTPQYIQTHTAPYYMRVAVVYQSDFLKEGTGNASVRAVLQSHNTRLGSLLDELRERGAEVHYYDTETLMDSTSSVADAAGEQGQPIWNTFGDHYPVTLMVGFQSQLYGTLSDRRPFFKAYSTNTQMIHVPFNTFAALQDNSGITETSNCGTGAFNSSFGSASSASPRVCLYGGGNRDTVYGRNLSFVTRAPDSVLNSGIHSIVRLFKPVASTWTHSTGLMPSGDDSVAASNELMPVAHRVYWKVPSTSTKGRWVDYVLIGGTADDELSNWQHIVAALIMRYTKIPPLPVGWVDADDNGNFGLNKLFNESKTTGQVWPTPARLDSIATRAEQRWGVLWNWNGPIDSMIYYRDTYGYNYLRRARYMTQHAHDSVSTHIYGNVYGRGSTSGDTLANAVNTPRTAFVFTSPANRTTDAATRDLGIYWRLLDHQNRARRNFDASGGHYLNTPNTFGLPLGIRVQNFTGYTNTNGNGNCPPDSFFLALSYAGIHSLATGFDTDPQHGGPDSAAYYMHHMAKAVTSSPNKWFARGDERWTSPAGLDPQGRMKITGEQRTVQQMQWMAISEVTPQAAPNRETSSNALVASALGLRRISYTRPQIRYHLSETSIPVTTGPALNRSRNMAFSRVRSLGLHPRYFTVAGSNNNFGDWHLFQLMLNHFSAMNGLAGRPAYRFVEPWMTTQSAN